jgi:hypothetical protein
MGAGASSAPDCVALQGRPVKGSFAVASDGASATLDSPAPPGGFQQLSDEAPLRLSQPAQETDHGTDPFHMHTHHGR